MFDLSSVRLAAGFSQVELASALEKTQGYVSKVEHQSDMLVSTLTAYLAALGATTQIVVDTGDVTMIFQLPAGGKCGDG
ncbi:hypothetical protein A5658_08560 [Mycobacterium sp. 1245111.1]|nr:hypothetical protein A5658_08560 [Mycobacterium sp. 1245111.1]